MFTIIVQVPVAKVKVIESTMPSLQNVEPPLISISSRRHQLHGVPCISAYISISYTNICTKIKSKRGNLAFDILADSVITTIYFMSFNRK